MRLHIFQAFVALLALTSTPLLACKQLVKYPEHLIGTSSDWTDAYWVVEIVEAHQDRIVGRITNSFGARTIGKEKTILYFLPDEESHAICATPFEVGETYLVFSTVKGDRREISRFNWMNVPKGHGKFQTYVADIEKASAANK
jgi:hypothetical protein